MYSVKQVADIFEVTPNTVRNWDLRGVIKADRITPTGRKFYSEEQIEKLLRGGNEDER